MLVKQRANEIVKSIAIGLNRLAFMVEEKTFAQYRKINEIYWVLVAKEK